MDLKRLRTFVAVAELGTVSKAALRLRISQSALSRQISDLEYECGFKLFDRIGRRLFLTTRGEQLLGDCRGVLGQMGSLGERIELLKRGDSGVIKVAAPPQTIESVLSKFLPRYAERFPNVRVKLTEALGMDQVPLIERGEVDVGIRHDQGANPWFDSLTMPPDDVLAACPPSLPLGRGGMIDIVALAAHPLLLPDGGYSVRRLFNAACRIAGFERGSASLAAARTCRGASSDRCRLMAQSGHFEQSSRCLLSGAKPPPKTESPLCTSTAAWRDQTMSRQRPFDKQRIRCKIAVF